VRSWTATTIVTVLLVVAVGAGLWWRTAAVDTPTTTVLDGKLASGDDPLNSRDIATGAPKVAHVILRLIDEEGEAVPDTLVVLDGQHGTEAGPWSFSAVGQRTDAQGRVMFRSVPFGRWPVIVPDVAVALEGPKAIAVGRGEVAPGSTLEFDIPLVRQRAVRGIVRGPDAEPVPHVGLEFQLTDPEGTTWQQSVRSNAEGEFVLYQPPRVPVHVRAEVSTPNLRGVRGAPMSFDLPTSPPGDAPELRIVVEAVPLSTFG